MPHSFVQTIPPWGDFCMPSDKKTSRLKPCFAAHQKSAVSNTADYFFEKTLTFSEKYHIITVTITDLYDKGVNL